jgi:lipid-binding SYLF domain-containing protein
MMGMTRAWANAAALALLVGLLLAAPLPAAAQVDQQKLVNAAQASVERLRTDPNYDSHWGPLLQSARAVLIVPNLVKAGFILGGEYGMGVMLLRRADGNWSSPAFYTVTAGSFGIQAGFQDAEVMFAVMSERALQAIMANSLKFGADLGLAIMVLGGGMEAATTTNFGADIYAFSRAVGLFGGGSLEGAVIKPRSTWNAAYYGRTLTPEDILHGETISPQADALRQTLGP